MFNLTPDYERILLEVFGEDFGLKSCRLIAAGNVNQAIFLESEKGLFFLKTNFEQAADIFEKETNGLDLLRDNTFLQVPKTYGHGKMGDLNYLVMEWIPDGSPGDKYWEELAHGLAQLHMKTASQFGLQEDNYIAVLPQANNRYDKWPDFFVENRIEKMLTRAFYKGLIDKGLLEKCRKIYPRISSIFPNEKPALIHGDLWSGNVMVNRDGRPCVIDPAVYFGQREMDLAFSKLFGGFNDRFYAAYEEVFPTDPGFEDRIEIYNLYPLLVHLNLFGQSYLAGIKKVIKRYVG